MTFDAGRCWQVVEHQRHQTELTYSANEPVQKAATFAYMQVPLHGISVGDHPHQLEGLAVAIPWGFESPLPHQPSPGPCLRRGHSDSEHSRSGQREVPGWADTLRGHNRNPPTIAYL